MNTNEVLYGLGLIGKGFAQPVQPIAVADFAECNKPYAGLLPQSFFNLTSDSYSFTLTPSTADREETLFSYDYDYDSVPDYDYDYDIHTIAPSERTRELILVQDVREDAQEAIMELLVKFESNDPDDYSDFIKWVESQYSWLGGGHFSRVFDVMGYAVKLNNPYMVDDYGGLNDGKILHDLLGAPCVPQVYAYSENSEIVIMDKVDGKVIYEVDSQFCGLQHYNHDREAERLERTRQKLIECGYTFQDCHGENTMLGRDGHFYVIDVGLFASKDWGSEEECYAKCSRHLDNIKRRVPA